MNRQDESPMPSIPDDWVVCTCKICKGAYVSLGTRRQHIRVLNDRPDCDKASTVQKHATKVNSTDTPNNVFVTAQKPNAEVSPPLDERVFKMAFMSEALEGAHVQGVENSTLAPQDQAVFEKLWRMDEAAHFHEKLVSVHIAAMDEAVLACDDTSVCTSKLALEGDTHSLRMQLEELSALDTLGEESHEVWKGRIRKLLERGLEKLVASGYTDLSTSCMPTSPESKIVDTSIYLGMHVHVMNPLILIPLLLVISLNLFAHLSRDWCNSTLRVLHLYAKFAVYDSRNWNAQSQRPRADLKHEPFLLSPSPTFPQNQLSSDVPTADAFSDLESLLRNFPLDLRTLRNRFGIQGKIEVYAVCPDEKCCAVYPPIMENGVKTYPRHCTKVHLRNKVRKECGELLSAEGVVDGMSVRVPIKAFPVQDWDDFKARMVADPLILTLLRRGMACAAKTEMRDIKDGTQFANLVGIDGKPFMDGRNNELRLAWSFSTDWFNAFRNHISGKTATVGSIAMTCLNLPPSFRYKAEYVFLAGVIPGPEEPKDDMANNFLDVIVDQLERSYKHGTHFTTTYVYPGGINERSIVAVFVFDLPGARKCCGMHSHSSKRNFCHLCRLHISDINNLEMSSWNLRDRNTHIADALAWKAEPVKTKRDHKFSETGVRWSPFLRLPYFHPHRSVVIDGMHNLFLGLCMHHVREFLGIDAKAAEESRSFESKVNIHALAKARMKLKEEPNVSTIKSFSVGILRALCDEYDTLIGGDGLELQPKDLRRALLTKAQLSRSANPEGAANGQNFFSDLIGEDYFDELDKVRVLKPILGHELKMIHSCIASTVRPRWHKSPPRNLGEARHGKLKADQWRSLMEFDIPVALAQLWDEDSERRPLFHCTMLLAIAMRYATSHVITKDHVDQYKRYMLEYLKLLREIDPVTNLRPNHHEALHIPDFLEYFGPIHGWWMFVYERTIGLLQSTNTNFKVGGQMERTMMESFCAAAHFRSFLSRCKGNPDRGCGIQRGLADAGMQRRS